MKKLAILLALLAGIVCGLLPSASAFGQVSNPSIIYILSASSLPSTCTGYVTWEVVGVPSPSGLIGTIYTCVAGVPALYGGGGGSGTVNSVALVGSGSGHLFSATSGTPVTSSGNLNVDAQLQTQAANCVVAGPSSGGNAAPSCRPLVSADIITANAIASTSTLDATESQLQPDSATTSIAYGLTTFGDSNTNPCSGVASSTNCYPNIIASDYRTILNNQGVAGDLSEDESYHIFTVLNPQDTGNPVVTSMIGTNDVTTVGLTQLGPFIQALYAIATRAAISGPNVILAGNSSVAITGSTTTDTTFANANGKTCTTGTCTFSYTASLGNTVPYTSAGYSTSGTFYLWFELQATGGTLSATVDGVACRDTIGGTTSVSAAWGTPPAHQTVYVGAIRCTGYAPNTTHNIIVTVNATAATTFIGFAFPPTSRYRGSSSPRIFLSAIIPEGGNTNASTTQTFNGIGGVLGVSQTLTSDGLSVPFVDAYNRLDYNLDISSGGAQNCAATLSYPLHLNVCGQILLSKIFESEINGQGFDLTIPLKQTPSAATIPSTGFAIAGGNSSTTGLNQGYCVSAFSPNDFCWNLGYVNGTYSSQFFYPSTMNFSVGHYTGGSEPTGQSAITTDMTVSPSGVASSSFIHTGQTGYLYANNTTADTASTTIPSSALSGTISVTNNLTLNNSNSGATSGATFNGSAAVTLSANTLGAGSLTNPNTWSALNTFSNSPGTGSGAYGTLFSGSPTTSSLFNPEVYINGGGTNPTWSNEGPMLAINTPSGYSTSAHSFEVSANGTPQVFIENGVIYATSFAGATTGGLFSIGNGRANFSSPSTGLVDVGTGGVTGTGGSLAATAFESAGTKFTATGCTSITSTVGGATAGKFTIGAASCTVVITMNGATGFTANNGYSCHANDETTAAGNTGLYFSANSTTTATLTVPATAAASDVIDFGCDPY